MESLLFQGGVLPALCRFHYPTTIQRQAPDQTLRPPGTRAAHSTERHSPGARTPQGRRHALLGAHEAGVSESQLPGPGRQEACVQTAPRLGSWAAQTGAPRGRGLMRKEGRGAQPPEGPEQMAVRGPAGRSDANPTAQEGTCLPGPRGPWSSSHTGWHAQKRPGTRGTHS